MRARNLSDYAMSFGTPSEKRTADEQYEDGAFRCEHGKILAAKLAKLSQRAQRKPFACLSVLCGIFASFAVTSF